MQTPRQHTSCAPPSTACRCTRARRCSTGSTPTGSSSAPTRTAGRRLPDARRAPQRRPHEPRELRPRLGPLHGRPPAPRPATERELHTLKAMLEASIALDRTAELSQRSPSTRRPRRHRRARPHAELRKPAAGPGCALPPLRRLRARGVRRARARASRRSGSSPGRMNCISGTMQAGEVLSRKRTASAMSSGWIISSFGT